MHEPYEITQKHKADFKVRYKFRSPEEGGRKSLPFQGIRSDFSYEEDEEERQSMIWPEFLDATGKLITDSDTPVPESGTALMWIINPERRPLHQKMIRIGTKGFFREGTLYTADCEVIEIIALHENPVHK